MRIPIWMATAILELGLTKEDFDAFFLSAGRRLPPIERSASKTRPVMSGTPSWQGSKDIDPIWEEIFASCHSLGGMNGDDGILTVAYCDED